MASDMSDAHAASTSEAAASEAVEYLTPGEVARLLHVSPKTVNRWANEGRLPCIATLGGHRRFPRHVIAEAVEQMTAGAS